jgi:CBS domain-containing protein
MQLDQPIVLDTDDLETILSVMQVKKSATAMVKGAEGNFLGILSLEDVSGAKVRGSGVSALINSFPVVYSDTKLEDLIPISARTDAPVPVVDKTNKLLGAVDRTSVMMAVGGKQ